MEPLTRKEFYTLAEYCRINALELAKHDQSRVSLEHCYQFNRWLPQVKRYEQLSVPLQNLKPARPIARWQLLVLGIITGLILLLALPSWLDRTVTQPFSTVIGSSC